MLIIMVRKWERRMVNDDGDVVRVRESKVVRGDQKGMKGMDIMGSRRYRLLGSALRVLTVFMECTIRGESI